MSVSVALCTYNGEQYLKMQLDSILRQTVAIDEIVICDDCSSDKTMTILKQYQEQYPQIIRVFENQCNIGYVKNFERAMHLCNGDIVFLSDQDDIWFPNKVEKIVDWFSYNADKDVVFTNTVLINEEGVDIGKTSFDYLLMTGQGELNWNKKGHQLPILCIFNRATGATMAIRKTYAEKIPTFPQNIIHDYFIALKSAADNKLGCIFEPLIMYRLHQGQQIGLCQLSDDIAFTDIYRLRYVEESVWGILPAGYPTKQINFLINRRINIFRILINIHKYYLFMGEDGLSAIRRDFKRYINNWKKRIGKCINNSLSLLKP